MPNKFYNETLMWDTHASFPLNNFAICFIPNEEEIIEVSYKYYSFCAGSGVLLFFKRTNKHVGI